MQRKISKVCFFLLAMVLVSCGPAMLPQSPPPITTVEDSLLMTAQMGSTLSAMLTQTAELCTSQKRMAPIPLPPSSYTIQIGSL